jgi:hypothetical protein
VLEQTSNQISKKHAKAWSDVMKSEFKFVLRGGNLFVVVFIFALLLIFSSAVFLFHETALKWLAALVTASLIGMLWYGYNQSFGCRSVSLEGNCLTVVYRLGKRVRFLLPEAVKDVVAYTHDQRSQNPDNLQLVLRDHKTNFLLNVSCYDEPTALLTALEAVIPMSRCYSDGRVEPIRLSAMTRPAGFVDVVGKPDEVLSKLGRQTS